jgi:hypothetical protein
LAAECGLAELGVAGPAFEVGLFGSTMAAMAGLLN